MKKRDAISYNNILLAVGIIVLLVLCVVSISAPMRFADERKTREQMVMERLREIRQAEEDYRAKHGKYCNDIDRLAREMKLKGETRFIPGTEKKKWKINTAIVPGSNGKTIPLMECGAKYDEYLQGLDQQEIDRLNAEAEQANRYPGLKIGNTVTPNNNAGNWE